MKSIWLITLLFALGLSLSAQSKAPAATPAKAAPSADAGKFDPLRDPSADLKAAVALASKERKRIIIDVGGEWCVWCHILDGYLAANPDLAKLRDDNYVWFKVNMSEENENKAFLSAYPEIKGYPHLFVLDSDGTFLHSQDTSPLESKKSYDHDRFQEFLLKWVPGSKDAVH